MHFLLREHISLQLGQYLNIVIPDIPTIHCSTLTLYNLTVDEKYRVLAVPTN